jgi:hypothetical protein
MRDTLERPSVLDGLDQLTGVVVLVATAMIGLDLYFWLGLNKPPRLSILWMPPIAVNMWRRLVTGVDRGPWPASWYRAMAVYSLVVLAIVVFKGPRVSDDWWMAGFAVIWTALSFWKSRS